MANSIMKVWIVSDNDYDCTRIVAVYPTEAMADDHVTLMGGYVEKEDVRDALHPDATDSVKQAERAAEAERRRRWRERRDAIQEANYKLAIEMRPRAPHMRLCHCVTFSSDPYFITEHGYCRHCGGWTPEVFRRHKGEDALQSEIDKLAIRDRERMRQLFPRPDGGT